MSGTQGGAGAQSQGNAVPMAGPGGPGANPHPGGAVRPGGSPSTGPSTGQSGSGAGGAGDGNDHGKQPTASEVRKLKLKIEGQDVELPESEVIALAQQGRSAAKRFQEAAQIKKQSEDLAARLKANPKAALAQLGIDVRKFSEETLVEILQAEAMSPEQRKAAENEQKLKDYEAAEKKASEETKQRELEELKKKHMQTYDQLFTKALMESGLPKTPYTVKRMAELQRVNLKKGLNLDAGSLAKVVREDYIAEQKQLFGTMEGEALMEALGPEIIKKLSKAQIAKLKARGNNGQFAGKAPARTEAAPTDSGSSWKDFKRKNRFRNS